MNVTAIRTNSVKGDLNIPKVVSLKDTQVYGFNQFQPLNDPLLGIPIRLGNSSIRYGTLGEFSHKKMRVAETAAQLFSAQDSNYNVATQESKWGLTATGSTQGAGLPITVYLNGISTSTASTGIGVTLDSAVFNKTRVVINTSVNTLSIFPATGQYIQPSDGTLLAINTATSLLPGARIHLVASNPHGGTAITSLRNVAPKEWYSVTALGTLTLSQWQALGWTGAALPIVGNLFMTTSAFGLKNLTSSLAGQTYTFPTITGLYTWAVASN